MPNLTDLTFHRSLVVTEVISDEIPVSGEDVKTVGTEEPSHYLSHQLLSTHFRDILHAVVRGHSQELIVGDFHYKLGAQIYTTQYRQVLSFKLKIILSINIHEY